MYHQLNVRKVKSMTVIYHAWYLCSWSFACVCTFKFVKFDILLSFIKAQITGNRTLHVEAFTAMLPWLTVYDHTNYARWGPVYLMDMVLLGKSAPEVYKEFMAGNCVVKLSKNAFNGVPADQATEWINGVCKSNGGIIGITKSDQARDRFCITWSIRSQGSRRNDTLPSRIQAEEKR